MPPKPTKPAYPLHPEDAEPVSDSEIVDAIKHGENISPAEEAALTKGVLGALHATLAKQGITKEIEAQGKSIELN